MTDSDVLFESCVISGCRQPIVPGDSVCRGCLDAFGPMLRETGEAGLSPPEVAARDAEVVRMRNLHRAVADLAELRKSRQLREPVAGEVRRNQVCWLCEERRTCMSIMGRWECRSCQGK